MLPLLSFCDIRAAIICHLVVVLRIAHKTTVTVYYNFKDPALQLQTLWAELKAGLRGVVQQISTLQQSNSNLEEKVSECQRDTVEKILSLRNTLNTLQEDTGTALSQISELNIRQNELQTELDLLQRTQRRKFTRVEELMEGHTFSCSQTQLELIQHYISSLPTNQISKQGASDPPKAPLRRERKESRDLGEQISQDISQRQLVALELLESERVYVSCLSLLLKANITYNDCENSNLKEKRLFPSSLRFLIQQHLELLHLLQERVLKSHWKGIMGDVFLRFTSKEHHQKLLTYLHTHRLREPERTQNLCTHQPDRMPHTHMELSRSDSERVSVVTDLAHGHSRKKAAVRCYSNWEVETDHFHPDIFFTSDSESHHEATPTQRHKFPETEGAGSVLADTMGAFLPFRDRDSHCSSHSHSTDSSIDVAYMSCNPSNHPDHRGRRRRGGVHRHNRGCMSPDSTSVMQPVQRKSKSLNGLQLDTIDSHAYLVSSPAHPRLMRQSSAKSRLRNSSQEKDHNPDTHTIAEEDSRPPIWEEFKWKGVSDEGDHTPLSECSKKESKGFRSSFKKLFKKR
ncbi:Rho guanine nucleotide exchange factor 33 [Bagarius yarrelli]|uniref:Rho guanine nucleotide exchange factor 33 n=1 Tax=Bagarius yarrelli TaxID=175774 RepID=A0A556V2X1_BAGYA|nr:Rho guanine nucleotide exchange factor 33 [Bagarius yarrelli]